MTNPSERFQPDREDLKTKSPEKPANKELSHEEKKSVFIEMLAGSVKLNSRELYFAILERFHQYALESRDDNLRVQIEEKLPKTSQSTKEIPTPETPKKPVAKIASPEIKDSITTPEKKEKSPDDNFFPTDEGRFWWTREHYGPPLKETDPDKLYRGYLQVKEKYIQGIVQFLQRTIAKELTSTPLDLQYLRSKFVREKELKLLNQYYSQGRIGLIERGFSDIYDGLNDPDPRIMIMADNPQAIQEIFTLLFKNKYLDTNKVDQYGLQRPNTKNYIDQDGKEWRGLNYLDQPGYANAKEEAICWQDRRSKKTVSLEDEKKMQPKEPNELPPKIQQYLKIYNDAVENMKIFDPDKLEKLFAEKGLHPNIKKIDTRGLATRPDDIIYSTVGYQEEKQGLLFLIEENNTFYILPAIKGILSMKKTAQCFFELPPSGVSSKDRVKMPTIAAPIAGGAMYILRRGQLEFQ